MKILIITFRYPFPEVGGEYLRINNIARFLRNQGHEIVLLSLFNPKESSTQATNDLYNKVYLVRRWSLISHLYSLFAFILGQPLQTGYFFSIRLFLRLKSILKDEKPDKIILHTIRTTQYFFLMHLFSNVIVEATDALSKTYLQCSKSFSWRSFNLKQFLYLIEQKKVFQYEKKVKENFYKIVFVSEDDIKFLDYAPNMFCYPNGVETFTHRAKPDKHKLVFVGNMRSLQNEDAALYFIHDIFPIIQKSNSYVTFYIVGANPSQKLISESKKHKNIVVTGYLENLDQFIDDAAVSVAPIRYAAGIQNKVLISMAHHIPIVISPLIANGIPELIDNVNCFIRSNANDFASACLSCIERSESIKRIENNAFDVVSKNYSWDSKLNGYLD